MVIRRRSGAICLNAPLRIWLLAGASSLVLATVVMSFVPRTVQADALLVTPAASVPPSVSAVQSAAPASLSPKRTIAAQRAALLRGIATWHDSRGRPSGMRELVGLTVYAVLQGAEDR